MNLLICICTVYNIVYNTPGVKTYGYLHGKHISDSDEMAHLSFPIRICTVYNIVYNSPGVKSYGYFHGMHFADTDEMFM